MEFWIELVMKYKEILISIRKIKKQRDDFINNFQTDKTFVYESLVNAIDNDNLNSIRVHKYLTSNKLLGKVVTARYLESINLNENTKIYELTEDEVSKISSYSIKKIKKQREDFINNFQTDKTFVYESLVNAIDNDHLNSIRVHKYLTSNKLLGKVVTARYLESINLNENTKIYELTTDEISNISSYSIKK